MFEYIIKSVLCCLAAIMGTFQDKGAEMFWHVVKRLQLSTQSVVAWKFCHVLHKVLRDGHPNVSVCAHLLDVLLDFDLFSFRQLT